LLIYCFLASGRFHKYNLSCGSVVLVCRRRSRSLRRPSNFHATCFRTDRRRPGRFCGRGERSNVYLAVSRIPLVSRSVESKIQHARIQLLAADWDLRRCRHDCVFSSLSKRWSAFRRSSYFGGWGRDYGHRGHFVFPRNSFMAASRRRSLRHHRIVFAA
jgi:hypothetical protein